MQRDDDLVIASPSIGRQHETQQRVFFLLRTSFGDDARADDHARRRILNQPAPKPRALGALPPLPFGATPASRMTPRRRRAGENMAGPPGNWPIGRIRTNVLSINAPPRGAPPALAVTSRRRGDLCETRAPREAYALVI